MKTEAGRNLPSAVVAISRSYAILSGEQRAQLELSHGKRQTTASTAAPTDSRSEGGRTPAHTNAATEI